MEKINKVIPIDPRSLEGFKAFWVESMEQREQMYRDMGVNAYHSYKELASECENLEFSQDDNGRFEVFSRAGVAINSAIQKNLNYRTIAHFIEAVLADAESARQTALAMKKHQKNRDAKELVFEWCDKNMSRFKSMDDAAMDIAESFIPQKFRTVREWMTEWKKHRSTGRP
jgi:hypothetical protein